MGTKIKSKNIVDFSKEDDIRDNKIRLANFEAGEMKLNKITPLIGKKVNVLVELPNKDTRTYKEQNIKHIEVNHQDPCGSEVILQGADKPTDQIFSVPTSHISEIEILE